MSSKRCPQCEETKDLTEFVKSARRPLGRGGWCRPCHSRKTGEGRTPEAARRQWLKRAYGMTPEDYEALLEAQDGTCAICNDGCTTFSRLSVDHDHVTGKVRGLLCNSCNIGIGKLKDAPPMLASALRYLAKHGKALPTEELHALLYGNTHDNPHRRL